MRAQAEEELELKYDAADPRAVADWLDKRFPAAADGGWRTVLLSDRYFDTADGALAAAGYGARLRSSGRTTSLGLKSDIAVVGARHRRREIEAPATRSLRPARWPLSAARAIVERLAGRRRLVQRLVIRQRRRERTIVTDGATLVVSLDDARVLVGGAEVGRLRGLEVEHVGGRRAALAGVAAALEGSSLVVVQPHSKLRLAEGLARAAQGVRADEAFTEAGRRVLRRHLLRLLEREPPMREGDALALKQMRVATRRMRSVWRVFDGAYRRGEQRRYLDELRVTATRLGAVRDLDVLLEGLPAEPALVPLADAWRTGREAAWAELLALIDADAYRRFIDDYLDFVERPGRHATKRLAGASVADEAPDRIRRAYQRLVSVGPSVAAVDAVGLHGLRILGKRLRYTLETFRDVLPEPLAGRLLARLVAMQDHLGALNDAIVAGRAAADWLADAGQLAPADTRLAVAAYVAERRAAADALRRRFSQRWRSVAGVTFARDLERAAKSLSTRAQPLPFTKA